MAKRKAVPTATSTNPSEHHYDEFEVAVAATLSAPGPLFETDADPDALWAAYIGSIPTEWRDHYECHACRNFVKNLGGLVRVEDDGSLVSAVWPERVPEFFVDAATRLRRLASKAKITGVFLSSEPTLGTVSNVSKKTGTTWTHLHGKNGRPWRVTSLTASQKAAALREDHGVLCRSFAEYGEDVVAETLRVLKSDTLDRGSKALEIVEWYVKVLADRKSPGLVWRHVASAPAGWCHIKNTVVSTLMDDVANGVSFETAKRKWAEKMHPLQYLRPQAPPTDGAILAAEKFVEKLRITRSLERRFARLDELTPYLLWTPRAPESKPLGSVFGHLRQKSEGVKRMKLPAKSVSIEEFVTLVLPNAKQVMIDLAYADSFTGITTAVHPDAPPILRWDYEDERNPFAWYLYHGGSTPGSWGLSSGACPVAAVLYGPQSFSKDEARRKRHETDHARQLMFVLPGARDSRGGCLALFPECIRGELHGVRSVIEAHNNRVKPIGGEEADANGVVIQAKQSREVTVDGDRYLVGSK